MRHATAMARSRERRSVSARSVCLAAIGVALVTVLGGCVTTEPTPAAAPAAVVVPSTERVVTYQSGRYELRGDGSAAAPYYWVWIPSGAVVTTLPPVPQAPLVATPPVVVAPAQRVAAYQTGRYELVGQGTATSPYYWVWVPTGATALPPPPPLPTRQGP